MAFRAPGRISMEFDHFQVRINSRVASATPGWMYEIQSFYNKESIKESPPELQAGFIWNLIISQLSVDQRMASRAPGWI